MWRIDQKSVTRPPAEGKLCLRERNRPRTPTTPGSPRRGMAQNALLTLLNLMEVLRPALTTPSFDNMLVVFAGWVLTSGPHAVTQALVETNVAGRRHHEAFHRFFSRGTWDPDVLGHQIFKRLLGLLGGGPIRVVLDDTLAKKKGSHVFGLGCHLDAVRSTRAVRVFAFGHVWVMLAVLLEVPFSRRSFALPVLFRLYRNLKESKAHGDPHKKKTELAREMLDVLATWVDKRHVDVAADSAYCNDTITRGLPENFNLVGSMRPDAVLTEVPVPRDRQRGRPLKRGTLLPKPENLAKDEKTPWQTCTVVLYGGKTSEVKYKTMCGQWYRACGTRLLRIVIVQCTGGTLPIRVYFSMDANFTVVQILEGYARRWSIEVAFRELKQLLGFADSSARKRTAVERTAPFVGFIYSLIVIWFAEGACTSPLATPPLRPWYSHKNGLCFADALRAAQRALAPIDILDPRRDIKDLRKSGPHAHRATKSQRSLRRKAA